MKYASETTVPVEKSRAEIEKMLMRYGASKFGYGFDADIAVISFVAKERMVRFTLPLPKQKDFAYTNHASRQLRSQEAKFKAWEQACRQRWRALCLVIKAKLEAVDCGISTFEEEFLAHIIIPGEGKTVGQYCIPRLEQSYAGNPNVKLLPM